MGFGDEVMTSGHVREMYRRLPRRVRIDYGKPLWTYRQTEVFANNPKIAPPGDRDAQVYHARVHGLRPYHTLKTKERWTYNPDYRAPVGEFFFTEAEKAAAPNLAGCIVINTRVKPKASPNKHWGASRWIEFVRIARLAGHRLVELGSPGSGSLVEPISTRTFRDACLALATADAYVGHESGLHHAAAALGIRGVVIFGGFTPVELTGYALHSNLGVSFEGACGFRLPCEHCAHEMAKIEPDWVLEELEAVLNGADRDS